MIKNANLFKHEVDSLDTTPSSTDCFPPNVHKAPSRFGYKAASQAQLNYLRSLGLSFHPHISKSEAQKLLSDEIAHLKTK